MIELEAVEQTSARFGALGIEDDTPLVLSNKLKIQVPSKLNSSLYNFQREGVQFLYQSFAKDSGAILNDVSGSGKKIQVIALISALISSGKALSGEHRSRAFHPALIICRKEKIRRWENRIKRWSSLKYSVCSDLNIDKASDSVDVVLFPFDLLSKSVVSVAKRKWKILFVDDVDVITLKPKYEVLLHHLPPVHRFGITSKNLDSEESLAAVIGWVYPKYYEQLKKERAKIFSYIKQFDGKTGTVSDQIRGLHCKAHLLSLRNEFFVKRNDDIPRALSSLPREEEEEEETSDCLPSTSSRRAVPSKSKKRKSNEKISPKPKSQRISALTLGPASSDEGESFPNKRNRVSKLESSTNHRSSRNKVHSINTLSHVGADDLAEPIFSKRTQKASGEEIESKPSRSRSPNYKQKLSRPDLSDREPKPSCSKHFDNEPIPSCSKYAANTMENVPEDPNSSENASVPSRKDFDKIDALFLSDKVLKSPQKSKKKVLDSTKPEEKTENTAEHSSDTEETSLALTPDFETKQLAVLNSLFLKTPPVSKPAPSKFKSFTQLSQKRKTNASWESSSSNLFGTVNAGESQDLDSVGFCESQARKSPPRNLLEEKKISHSKAPEDLLEDLFFSQAARKAPPKRKPNVKVDPVKPSSRQPMQFIKNWDQDSAHLDDLSSKKNRF